MGRCCVPLTLGHASSVIAGAGACCCIKTPEETLLQQYELGSVHDG